MVVLPRYLEPLSEPSTNSGIWLVVPDVKTVCVAWLEDGGTYLIRNPRLLFCVVVCMIPSRRLPAGSRSMYQAFALWSEPAVDGVELKLAMRLGVDGVFEPTDGVLTLMPSEEAQCVQPVFSKSVIRTYMHSTPPAVGVTLQVDPPPAAWNTIAMNQASSVGEVERPRYSLMVS